VLPPSLPHFTFSRLSHHFCLFCMSSRYPDVLETGVLFSQASQVRSLKSLGRVSRVVFRFELFPCIDLSLVQKGSWLLPSVYLPRCLYWQSRSWFLSFDSIKFLRLPVLCAGAAVFHCLYCFAPRFASVLVFGTVFFACLSSPHRI